MKRFLLVSAAVVTIAGPTFAADLPVAPYPTKAPAYAASYNWTGFYIGANLGGGFSTANDSVSLLNASGVTVLGPTGTSTSLAGVIGGGQLGYNWQTGNIVLGIEADFDGSGQSGTSSFAAPVGITTTSHQENWFSTVRGRVGWAGDRWLFYVTGGVAFENLGHNTTFTTNAATFVPVGGETGTRTGYTVGGGVETSLWGNWTAGLEYLYIDTGNFNTNITPSAAFLALPGNVALGVATAADTQRFQNNIIRARLNFRF